MAGLAAGWRDYLSAWEEYRTEADEYRELDDGRVLVLADVSARGKASGVELGRMGAKAANLFHVRERKVTTMVTYYESERALADLGLAAEDNSPRS